MPIGPGKYDDLCTMVRERIGIDENTGGGVVLIVIGGNRGQGFSVQADLPTALLLPDILETTAAQMRKDAAVFK